MGIVIVAEYAEELTATNGNLGDVGHQVVGDATGIFTDAAALVCADGVEVTQQDDAPLGISKSHAGEDLLGHVLGPAIGVGATAGAAVLTQGHLVVSGVNRCRGGEDQILHAHLLHDLGQNQSGIQVIVIVFPGHGNTFANSLQTGKVDHTADLIFCKDLGQQSFVTNVAFVELQILAGQFLHTLQGLGVGIAQIVDDYNTVAAFQQLNTGVGANIAGTAGNQYVHRTYLHILII